MNTMTLNNSSDITFNVAESSSNSAQILIQMQSHIKQLKKQHQQQQLKNEMFNNYKKFVKKIITIFESINLKKEAEHKLEHLKQKKSASNYTAEFRQIVSVLN